MIDTHAHILDCFYKDKIKVLNQAVANNIKTIVNVAVDYETSQEILKFDYDKLKIYKTVGIHPTSYESFKDINRLESLITDEVIAIGECGFDKYHDKDKIDIQRPIFIEQIKLAIKYNKPVIVHSREATKETLEVLGNYPDVKVLIHCFVGDLETAKEMIRRGYYIAYGGVLTYKNAQFVRDSVIVEHLDHILLETDCPFLSPLPVRGKENQPAYINYVMEEMSKIVKMDSLELDKIFTNNFHKLFNIS